MTNIKMLNQKVDDSGMTKTFIANKIGVSRPRLYNILGGSEISVSEMLNLSNVLRLTNRERSDIFFTDKVV